MPPAALLALARLADAFERLGIPYAVGGSIASGSYGEPRMTHDADVLADLPPEKVQALVADLEGEFYVDEVSVREAVLRRDAFNVIHLRWHQKIDVFVAGESLLDREQLERRSPLCLSPDLERTFQVTSAEVIVLRKLDWFRRSQSDRQWRDVASVLKTQAGRLDLGYLRRTAAALDLSSLLERAAAQAGLPLH